jgi:hypothetical protein
MIPFFSAEAGVLNILIYGAKKKPSLIPELSFHFWIF